MMMEKIISIVTICRSNPADLEFTRASIVLEKECYPSILEWIVVDGSPDDACQVLLKEEGCADQIIHEADFGIYDAMNKGIKRASGRTVVMLNSGDRLIPGALEKVLQLSPDELECNIVYGDAIYKLNGRRFYAKAARPEKNGRVFDHLPIHQCAFIPNLFYKSNLYDVRFRISGDTELMSRAFRMFSAKYIPFPISIFEFGGISNNPPTLLAALTHWLEYSRLREFSGVRLLTAMKVHIGRFVKIRLFGFERYYLKEFRKNGYREYEG